MRLWGIEKNKLLALGETKSKEFVDPFILIQFQTYRKVLKIVQRAPITLRFCMCVCVRY
jgi:hypothetical protein